MSRLTGRSVATSLPPNVFAMVMATGIVSLAAAGSGHRIVGLGLFVLNVLLYLFFLTALVVRIAIVRETVLADMTDHAKAPGFFTMVAGPCVLGSQCVVLGGRTEVAALLLGVGLLHWVALSYVMLPRLMTSETKPIPERGLSGAWLLVVVGTQAISVLASLIAYKTTDCPEWIIFASLSFWLAGSMIYFWIMSQIFHRILFLPLAAEQLTPPYWINMGAMAIATLAGARLVLLADRFSILAELLPFVKGMTLLFWATATWWIPILIALGVGRHIRQRFPLSYDHSYWAAVFPLGMYTVATRTMSDALRLPFLKPIPDAFVWIALAAWAAVMIGFMRWLAKSLLAR